MTLNNGEIFLKNYLGFYNVTAKRTSVRVVRVRAQGFIDPKDVNYLQLNMTKSAFHNFKNCLILIDKNNYALNNSGCEY